MKNYILLLLCFVSLGLAAYTVNLGQNIQVKDFVAPPPLIEHYSLGMRYQLADIFWIRSLQDFDYCEQTIRRNACKGNSWLFRMISTIVDLDQEYYPAYAIGGLALTIIISDISGASKIFDRGVKQFPKEWVMLYRAAYHALYEENNYLKAADLFDQAGQNGAPDWTRNLAKRLKTKSGQIEVGERLLADLIRRDEDENIISLLREKIENIKKLPDSYFDKD